MLFELHIYENAYTGIEYHLNHLIYKIMSKSMLLSKELKVAKKLVIKWCTSRYKPMSWFVNRAYHEDDYIVVQYTLDDRLKSVKVINNKVIL